MKTCVPCLHLRPNLIFFRIQAETRLMSDVSEGKLDKNGFLFYICRFGWVFCYFSNFIFNRNKDSQKKKVKRVQARNRQARGASCASNKP